MKQYVVADNNGGEFVVDADGPRQAAKQVATDAAEMEYLYHLDGAEHYALFDEDGWNYDDLMVTEVEGGS